MDIIYGIATLLGGIAVICSLINWGVKKIQEVTRRGSATATTKADGARQLIIEEKTYYRYRTMDCPRLMTREVVEYLERRYACKALVVASISLPVTVLWRNNEELVPPDRVLGEFDSSLPTPFQSSLIMSDNEYKEAREFIRIRYEAPPSKVIYEGCDYRMISIDLSAPLPTVNGAFGLYYDNILTQYALEWELKKAILTQPGELTNLLDSGSLPLREAVERNGNPLVQGASRCAAITISTLVVFQRSKGHLFTIVRKRSNSVGISPGLHNVVPAGMFEAPNTEDVWSIEDNVWRELLEELYDEEEQIGKGRSEIKDYIRSQTPVALLRSLIGEGKAELSVTGICCDLLNLRPEICTVLYVPELMFAEARPMKLNWEYEEEGPEGKFGIRWEHLPKLVEDLASTGKIVVSGAACLELGREWLKRRHNV